MGYVIQLKDIEKCTLAHAGGKGANLGELARSGFLVPPAFVISAEAYSDFIESNGLSSRIQYIIRQHPANAFALVQKEFGFIKFPDNLAREIQASLGNLHGQYAVRSSATKEDLPGLSFAGQHESYLNIKDLTQVLNAVKMCWASLWTERAVSYRMKNNITDARMAVVIQQMAKCSKSGVMFTINPVSDNADEIIIEAAYGLGDALVSGRATPDRFVIRKTPHIDIIEKHMGVEQKGYCLSDVQVLDIARMGMSVEGHFNAPQDIEWCIEDGKIWVLQSRPATGVPPALSQKAGVNVRYGSAKAEDALKGHLVVWSNWNTRETMPNPQPPFGWSFWNEVVFPTLLEHNMGVNRNHPDFDMFKSLDSVNGRFYFNMNLFLGLPILGNSMFGMLKSMDNETYEAMQDMIESGEFQPLKFPHRMWSYWYAFLSISKMAVKLPFTIRTFSHKNAMKLYAEIEQEARDRAKTDYSGLTDMQLLNEAKDMCTKSIIKVWPTFIWYGFGFFGYEILRHCVKKYPDIKAEKFLAGMSPPNKTTEAALNLYKLTLSAQDAIKTVFLDTPVIDIMAGLGASKEGLDFIGKINEFLETYGHRAQMEFDITAPRWKDDPQLILQALKNYFKGNDGNINPIEHYELQKTLRQELINKVRKRLSQGLINRLFPFRRWIFEFGLRLTDRFYPIRENAKYYVMQVWQRAREMYMELGERFRQKGLLDSPNDFFFLYNVDVVRISNVSMVNAKEIKDIIGKRKAEYAKDLNNPPPFIVRSDGKPVDVRYKTIGNSLSGTPASPGIITARARVILNPSADAHLNAGEILVAPYTDPGWTPLFLTAGGLVMEVGGMMSHGAVVAREYGIPAVVGVKGALAIIKNGDIIEMNGSTGTVSVLK